MKDRLRRAGSAVRETASGGARRIRLVAVDDADDGDLLAAVDAPDEPELESLDAADDDAGDAKLGLDHFTELLARLDTLPPLPLAAPFSAGLVPLLQRWAQEEGQASFLADHRVARVLAMVGDRCSITVAPDGITVRGLLRRRFTPWERIRQLTFVPRYQMLREHALQGAIDDLVRSAGLRIPGLRWVLRRIISAIERRLPPAQAEALARVGGSALQRIGRRGFDLELSGALALVAFLSEGLSAVAAEEARLRGIALQGVLSSPEQSGSPAG